MARIFHRNLSSYITSYLNPTYNNNDTKHPCTDLCDPSCGDFEECYPLPPLPPPLPPISIVVSSTTTSLRLQMSPFALIFVIVLSGVILGVCTYAIVNRLCHVLQRFLTGPVHDGPVQPEDNQHPTAPLVQENNDRDEPGVENFHPIWLISSVGLQQSVINTITAVRYKSGDGLIDGSDCSVCLSEFQEGDNLRLLPKCRHAFHIDCIDTWLRSHTNCPLCRAGIVINPGRPSLGSNEPGLGQSSQAEPTRTANPDSNSVELGIGQLGNSSAIIENRDATDDIDNSDENKVFTRRSFSMDFSRFQRKDSNSSSGQEIDSSSSSRPLRPHSMKRSYSWSERVFLSSRDQNNGNQNVSP